jgi:hypothetical protein
MAPRLRAIQFLQRHDNGKEIIQLYAARLIKGVLFRISLPFTMRTTSAAHTQGNIQLKDWKKAGPLGKLHNLCVNIHASPQLLAKFKSLSKGLTLPQDNATRWGFHNIALSKIVQFFPMVTS